MTCPSHLPTSKTWRRRLLLGVGALGVAWMLSSCGEDAPPTPADPPRSQTGGGYRPPAAPAPQWGQPGQPQPWGQPPQPQAWGQPPQQGWAPPPQWGQQGQWQQPASPWGAGQGQASPWGSGSAQLQGQWGGAGGRSAQPPQNPWQQPQSGYGGQPVPQQRGWAQPQPMAPQFRPLEEEKAKEYRGSSRPLYAPYDRPIGSSQDQSQTPGWTGYPVAPQGYPGIAPAPWGWPGATGLPPGW